jgi:hypothetical protein
MGFTWPPGISVCCSERLRYACRREQRLRRKTDELLVSGRASRSLIAINCISYLVVEGGVTLSTIHAEMGSLHS